MALAVSCTGSDTRTSSARRVASNLVVGGNAPDADDAQAGIAED